MSFAARRKKLRDLIRESKADALLVTNFINVTYLTGFTGDDSYLLVTLDGETLITDPRYTTQLAEECPGLALEIREPGVKMLTALAKVLESGKVERLGIEGNSATVSLEQSLAKALPKVSMVVTENLVEQLRIVKDKSEVDATRVACMQAKRAYEVVRASITTNMTELEVAAELEYQARRFGAKGLSFPAIVAVGPRAALPHARPTTRKIGDSDFTLIDWGVNSGLYMSDLTRVIVTGKISPKLRKIYGVVLKAQLAAIDAIEPGKTCEQVDAVARKVITRAGFGKAFGHGLGHGTGLEIHEAPRLAVGQKTKLEPGMIVTVEPGIYVPGWGGVRIEDDVLVTRGGHEVLTDVPKELDHCQLAS
ncbi:MAG TPA: Xaa-Pro peptidase family protein [Lacipirellulaceae bacterium]|jgi:Xaa-Pro aminopeptidase|nr:Xaa-Pro peptidase family protein [Lacipirellulaceae bacterium]